MRRNRTLDRHTFLSRKQKPSETLHQFWNVLNGLAAKCDFRNRTEGLVYDIFILNMSNKQVQEKLCTEPKDNPLDALQFAIAFEDGLKRQKTHGHISQEAKVKEEPVCTVSGIRQNNRESVDNHSGWRSTSVQKKKKPTCRQFKEKLNGKWLRQEHLSETGENPTGWDKM